jgi:hypothetical protein
VHTTTTTTTGTITEPASDPGSTLSGATTTRTVMPRVTDGRFWAVACLFVVGLAAALVAVSVAGAVQGPALVAAILAPWLSHRVLPRSTC